MTTPAKEVGAGGTAPRLQQPSQNQLPAWGFLAFVVTFIIYGSLFPFDFRDSPEPIAKLFSSSKLFANVPDAIDNLLLFIPLAFALYASFGRTRDRLIASAFAIISLGFGLQVLQLYLPSRTASIADVVWNGIGLAVGLFMASIVHRWLGHRPANFTTVSPYALLLVLLWFFYEAFPFVPTLDYGLLREHIKPAILAPPFESIRFVQHLLAAILGGIALQRARLPSRSGLATVLAGSTAVMLEVFVAYGSLRRETLLGITIGLAGGYLLARNSDKMALTALLVVAASAYLMTIFTPYRGQIADAGFTFTPFPNFLWHNITSDLPPLAFESLAIGSLLWAGLFKPGARHPFLWIAAVLTLVVVLETIRVLALGYHGDTTTLLIAAVLGPFAAAHRNRQISHFFRPPNVPARHAKKPLQPAWRAFAVLTLLFAGAIYAVAHLPGMPYNIREIFPSGFQGVIAALSLSASLFLAVNSSFLLLSRKSRRLLILFPLLLPLQGIIIWILLRIGVPLESISDIVGAPILGWPWEWEMLLRFLALHQAIATQIIGAVLLVATICRPSLFAGFVYWLIVSLLIAWPLHLVIIDWAATDNLTELMRDKAAFTSSSLLVTGVLFSIFSGSALGAAIAIPARKRQFLLASLFAAPFAAGCFLAGLEPVLVKYGKVFSALQFLLSPDREHYLTQFDLLIRYALAYALSAIAIAILQFRVWNLWVMKWLSPKHT